MLCKQGLSLSDTDKCGAIFSDGWFLKLEDIWCLSRSKSKGIFTMQVEVKAHRGFSFSPTCDLWFWLNGLPIDLQMLDEENRLVILLLTILICFSDDCLRNKTTAWVGMTTPCIALCRSSLRKHHWGVIGNGRLVKPQPCKLYLWRWVKSYCVCYFFF